MKLRNKKLNRTFWDFGACYDYSETPSLVDMARDTLSFSFKAPEGAHCPFQNKAKQETKPRSRQGFTR